jgi:acetolactate synthase-1/2/3 large subunit
MRSTGNPNTLPPPPILDADSNIEGGDLIVHYLQQIGVEYIFGVPGGAIEPLVNAIARGMRRGGPKLVVARHESGAAFMADGYARETGKLGVCFATTGPGATNMITGVAHANQDNVPLLALTAQTRLENFGRGGLQESSCTAVDTVAIYKSFTRYSTLVSHPQQLENKLISAILAATREPGGAAHLSLPVDIARATSKISSRINLERLIGKELFVDESKIRHLADTLASAKKIVFVLGQGAKTAAGQILALALELNAAVVTTPFGKGLVSPYHKQFRGVIGISGHNSAVMALTDPSVDCIVCIGTSLGEFATGNWNGDTLLNERLIHIDSNAEHFTGSAMAKLHIHGSPPLVLERLQQLRCRTDLFLANAKGARPNNQHAVANSLPPTLVLSKSTLPNALPQALPNCALDEPEKYFSQDIPIKPQRVMRTLPGALPVGTRFVADGTAAYFWAIHYLHIPDRRAAQRRSGIANGCNPGVASKSIVRQRFDRRTSNESLYHCSGEFSGMGWGLGAAIGMAFAHPQLPVVVLTGDGSMLMNGQEITVAAQCHLPVIFAVLNDCGLGTVKHGQRLAGAEQIGYEIPRVDFTAMAHAMGVDGRTIYSAEDLESIDFSEIIQASRPFLLDIMIDPEEIPPIGRRMAALTTQGGYAN